MSLVSRDLGIEDDGIRTVAVVWTLTAIVGIWVVLRIWTRKFVIDSWGWDDNLYMVSSSLLIPSSICVTIAAYYGTGQSMEAIGSLYYASRAAVFALSSQTIATVSICLAKWSIGLFLLRILKGERWIRIWVWAVLTFLASASLAWILMLWLQCRPFAFVYDRRIEGGYCDTPFLPMSVIHASACVLADLIFAILPWFYIRKLDISPRERYVTLASLSLGFVAAAFGIVRATYLPALWSTDYLKTGTGIIIWTAAEIAVTLICIGIPTCRPLYRAWLDKFIHSPEADDFHSRNPPKYTFSDDAYGISKHGTNSSMDTTAVPMSTFSKANHTATASHTRSNSSRMGHRRDISGSPEGLWETSTMRGGTAMGIYGDELDLAMGKVNNQDAPHRVMVSSDQTHHSHSDSKRHFWPAGGRDRAGSSDEETLTGEPAMTRTKSARAPYESWSGESWTSKMKRWLGMDGRDEYRPVPLEMGILMGIRVTDEIQITTTKAEI